MGIIIYYMATTCFGQSEAYSECASSTLTNTAGAITVQTATAFVNDAVAALSGAINMVLSAGLGPAPADLIKAALAGRCAITGGITDLWKILMAAYLTLKALGMQNLLIENTATIPQSVCACKKMVQGWAAMLGSNGAATAAQLESCSESATTATTTTNSPNSTNTSNTSNSSSP